MKVSDNQNKLQPRKIVISNVRKSMMSGSVINPDFIQSQPPIIADSMFMMGQPANGGSIIQSTKQISKLTQQLNYYREKNDQSLIKVRFLTQKLESYGGLNNIPETITQQISETDSKIKKLQQLLHFRRSKQMKKLKKKVQKFVQMLEFQLNQEDLNKIEDQIEIIFFLIDIFSEKYNNIMSQKAEIDQIIQNLKEDTVFTREQLQQQNKYLKQKNTQITEYIRDLQIQIFNLKKQQHSFGRTNYNIDSLLRNPSAYSNNSNTKNSSNNKVYQQAIKNLQIQNENSHIKINKLENTLKNNQYEIINYKRKIEEYEHLLQNQRIKCRDLEEQLLKIQRQQIRWRQRYQIMQRQKNQRIQLLERQKKTMENLNSSYNGFQKKSFQDNINTINNKRGGQRYRIYSPNNNIKGNYGEKYQINEGIIQDSGQQYFDVGNI